MRELSHMVQSELWRYLPVTATPSRRLRPLARSWTLPAIAPIRPVLHVESDGA